MQTFQQLIKF